MTLPPSDVLIFRSARPGASLETWLFQKAGPHDRRALTSALAAFARHWRPGAVVPGGLRRRAPDLYEARVRVSPPARLTTNHPDRFCRIPFTTVSVFFVATAGGPILLSAGRELRTEGGGTRNLGLGDAFQLLRELRAGEQEGTLSRRLVLDSFQTIKDQSRPGRTIPWDKERQAGLILLDDVRELVRQEAQSEGAGAGSALARSESRYRLGLRLPVLRRRAGLTQRDLAARAGVGQPAISEIESGVVNPTFDTVCALVRALGARLEIG